MLHATPALASVAVFIIYSILLLIHKFLPIVESRVFNCVEPTSPPCPQVGTIAHIGGWLWLPGIDFVGDVLSEVVDVEAGVHLVASVHVLQVQRLLRVVQLVRQRLRRRTLVKARRVPFGGRRLKNGWVESAANELLVLFFLYFVVNFLVVLLNKNEKNKFYKLFSE